MTCAIYLVKMLSTKPYLPSISFYFNLKDLIRAGKMLRQNPHTKILSQPYVTPFLTSSAGLPWNL